jgi:hypothetical protein
LFANHLPVVDIMMTDRAVVTGLLSGRHAPGAIIRGFREDPELCSPVPWDACEDARYSYKFSLKVTKKRSYVKAISPGLRRTARLVRDMRAHGKRAEDLSLHRGGKFCYNYSKTSC